MLTIKVLGSGCANCKRLEQIAHKVVSEMGIEAEVIKVTEYPDIMAYNVLSTPGLVINEKVVSSGRIPTPAEVSTWLAVALETVWRNHDKEVPAKWRGCFSKKHIQFDEYDYHRRLNVDIVSGK